LRERQNIRDACDYDINGQYCEAEQVRDCTGWAASVAPKASRALWNANEGAFGLLFGAWKVAVNHARPRLSAW